jgi:DNA polymerase III sliding clamp (beta) subunit (PCNA family)
MKLSMKAATFAELATASVFADSKPRTPMLAGVLIRVNGATVTATATDSYRLVNITRDEVGISGDVIPLIIPADILAKAAKEFAKVRGSVVLESDGVEFSISSEDEKTRIGGRVIDGNYPDTDKLIPPLGMIHELPGGILLNPWLIADVVKLAPWAGVAKNGRATAPMHVSTITSNTRPIVITSRNEQTVVVVMPVRIN